MADSVSPPPEAPEITEARNRAAYEALRVYCAEPESFRRAADFAFDAGVAAGRTRAADYLDQRARVIHDTATSRPDKGLAAALFNVARELREGQENT